MIINITHVEFNKYIREHSVRINLNQIPFLLNFDSEGTVLIAILVLESSTIDITIQQANVMIYYGPFIPTTTLDVTLFTTSLNEQKSNIPMFLSSTMVNPTLSSSITVNSTFLLSRIVNPTLSSSTTVNSTFLLSRIVNPTLSSSTIVNSTFLLSRIVNPTLSSSTIVNSTFLLSTIVNPTFLLSTVVDTALSSSTTVDIIRIISAVPTQTNHILLNTEIAYIIGGSTTIVVIIVCCFIIVISFCCGRCSPCRVQRQNTINGQDRYVTTRPYVLTTTDTNTSGDIEMKTINLDNPDIPDEMNIYSLPDEERNNIYALPDTSDKDRLLTSSSRRPPPPPPNHSSRPLPPTPSFKLE